MQIETLVQQKQKDSIVVVKTEFKLYWFALVLLLLHLCVAGMTLQGEEYAFVTYFIVTEPIDEVDIVLNYLCLRLATEDKIDPTLNFNPTSSAITDIGE